VNHAEAIEALLATGREDDLKLAEQLASSPYMQFTPRPDRPDIGDEMTSYLTSDHPGKIVLGGTGCLAGYTPLYDPILHQSKRIDAIDGPFHVYSRNPDTGMREIGIASRPYCKGIAKLFRVELSNGLSFVGTSDHRVLGRHGIWSRVGSLQVGDALSIATVRQPEIHETALFQSPEAYLGQTEQYDLAKHLSQQKSGVHQSTSLEFHRPIPSFCFRAPDTPCQSLCPTNAFRSFRKPKGCLDHCCKASRRDGVRPLLASNIVQESLQQQDDAHEHSQLLSPLGVHYTLSTHSPTCLHGDHPSRRSSFPSDFHDHALRNQNGEELAEHFCASECKLCHAKEATSFPNLVQQDEQQQLRTSALRPDTIESYPQSATERESCNFSLTVEQITQYHHVTAVTPVGQGEFWDISVWPHENYELAGIVHHNSSKTYTTAYLFANLLYTNSPPEPNTPIWILATTLDQVGLLWNQALKKFIDPNDIQPNGIRWRKSGLDPEIVRLKPDAHGNNWAIYFYSCEQGREALQAATCWAIWIDEQAPQDVIEECWGRLRRWQHANMFILTCTPLNPDPWLQDLWDRRDEPEVSNLYRFFRLNTVCNDYLSPEWRRDFLNSLSPDQRLTRQFGDFCNYKGAVFPEFTGDLIIEPFDTESFEQYIGVDFGFHHPAILWMAKKNDEYFIIDEDQLSDVTPDIVAKKIKRRYDYRHKVIVDYEDIISARILTAEGVHNSPCVGKDVVASINLCKNLFWQKKIKVFRNCVQTIRQLRGYRWKQFKTDQEEKDSVVKVADHLVDAFRGVIYTTGKRAVRPWTQLENRSIRMVPKAGIPTILRPNQRGWDPVNRR